MISRLRVLKVAGNPFKNRGVAAIAEAISGNETPLKNMIDVDHVGIKQHIFLQRQRRRGHGGVGGRAATEHSASEAWSLGQQQDLGV